MSGGSYNYLCHASVEDLMDKKDDLQDMADRLAGLGYAADAASETMNLLLTVRQYENRMGAMIKRLEDVWHSVEWLDSGDSCEDSFKKSLEEYRNK